MARKISRRSLALYIADHLASGKPQKQAVEQLVAYLISTRRTKEIDVIVRDIQFYLSEKGHVSGLVTSAHELSASTLKLIEELAKSKTGASQVSLDTRVDEAVLGGVKLEIPGFQLDTTIA